MIRFDQPAEGVVAGGMFAATFVAGVSFEAGDWITCAVLLLAAMVALRGLRAATDRREQRAFDNGVRRMSDEAKRAIRETAKTSARRGAA